MEILKITPSKASKFGINIAKDGISEQQVKYYPKKGLT